MFCERLKCQTLLAVLWKILLGLFGIALSKRRAEKQIAEMNLPNVSGFLAV